MSQKTRPDGPYVPATTSLPEITVKAVLLGIALSALLGAANAYLGLFAGLTVSASIPAAVMSMAILKLFRNSNILENNIVQTAASAGESLAAGVIFTLPALILLGVWNEFDYLETTLIAGFGGLIGVLFTIPLRRALVVEQGLKFPEGVATAEVLKVGDRGEGGVKYIAWAGLAGGFFKLAEGGLGLWASTLAYARYAAGSIATVSINLSPALVGVGFIVGLNIATLVFLGGVLNFWVAIPIVAAQQGVDPTQPAFAAAMGIWSAQTRYLGVGAMVVGGLWALIKLRKSLATGIRSGLAAYKATRSGTSAEVPRTEMDTPMNWVLIVLGLSVLPLFGICYYFTGVLWLSALMAGIMLVAGFLFAAVAGYMAGLVGSSNNPISGVTIATLLTSALLLAFLMGADWAKGPAAAIFIGAVVACAAAIAGDNMQDLKAGHVLGATPWKQQIMQAVGVVSAALVIAPVLNLLNTAYGIGAVTPDQPNALAAPQATLMQSVAQGVFEGGLPWTMVGIGMVLAVAIILLDLWLEKRGSDFRTPVLAVAVGIYLPLELSTSIFLGGVIAWLADKALRGHPERQELGARRGLLFSAGLITGEALMGIGLAIPIVLTGQQNPMALGVGPWAALGAAALVAVVWALYKVATPARGEDVA